MTHSSNKKAAEETWLCRTYLGVDGIGRKSELIVKCSPERFEEHRERFRELLSDSGSVDKLPALSQDEHGGLWAAICYNKEWSSFFSILIGLGIEIEVGLQAELGSQRRLSAQDHHASLDRQDRENDGMMDLRSGTDVYHLIIEDQATDQFAPV